MDHQQNQNQPRPVEQPKILAPDLWSGVFTGSVSNDEAEAGLAISSKSIEIGAFAKYGLDDTRPIFGAKVKWTLF